MGGRLRGGQGLRAMSAGITLSGVIAGCLLALGCSIWLACAFRSVYLEGDLPKLLPALGALVALTGLVWETNRPGSLWSLSIPLLGWELNPLMLFGMIVLLLGAALTSVVEYVPAVRPIRTRMPLADRDHRDRDAL